jgi:HD superfamily phosphodiesterase
MITYEQNSPHRAGHFLKVHGYAKTIGEAESLDAETLFTLEAAALVHDIGIRPSLEKYGSGAGNYQESEGPPVAREMLTRLGFAPELVERVSFLVGHHHTYTGVDGLDWQILLEADFLVNMHEGEMSVAAIRGAYENVFRTETGREFCRVLYGV